MPQLNSDFEEARKAVVDDEHEVVEKNYHQEDVGCDECTVSGNDEKDKGD